MTGTRDWLAWHEPYADAGSELSRRLRLVQGHIAGWLDERPGESLTVVSACAGQGRDLIGVLAGRSDADRVRATLLELDPQRGGRAGGCRRRRPGRSPRGAVGRRGPGVLRRRGPG